MEVAGTSAAPCAAAEQFFDARVEPARALRPFAYRGEDAQAAGPGERFDGIVGVGERGPVREQRIAMCGEWIGLALVELHAGERARAQQCQRGIGIAVAHGGGERGEIEGGALAVAALQVDAAPGEACGVTGKKTVIPANAGSAFQQRVALVIQ